MLASFKVSVKKLLAYFFVDPVYIIVINFPMPISPKNFAGSGQVPLTDRTGEAIEPKLPNWAQ